MNIKKMICLLLSVVMAGALCACGGAKEQKTDAMDQYLQNYLTQNSFTVEENGVKTQYADYAAAEKLYELYTAEGDSEMLARFTKVENQLLKVEKDVPTGKETTYCHYDAQGVLQKTYTDTDMTVYFTYHYDENGRLTEKKLFSAGEEEPRAVCTYKYNKNGHCTRYQDENGKVSTFKYTYDEQGAVQVGPRVEFAPDGSLIQDTIRYNYTYDENGRVVQMAGQQTNGKDISYEFIYDEQGRAVQITNVMPEGNVTEQYRYEGDRLVEKTKTLKDAVTAEIYTYGTRYVLDTAGLNSVG